MVVDPVCGMMLDPSDATARLEYEGTRVYFCSEQCRRRFLAQSGAYSIRRSPVDSGHDNITCSEHHSRLKLDPGLFAAAAAVEFLATGGLLGLYFGALTLVSGWQFTVEQFGAFWPFIVALAIGFGIQVGLFTYLRRSVRGAAPGKVVAATGTTSGAAMISCCTHYLVNLLPVLGATGIAAVVGEYQVELFWLGLAANVAGIAFMTRRVVSFAHGA